ncbi:MAG TPA: zinc ribbon domain-containing protein [Terriglobales bacterium]|nr:zinc ribbon domain-containing protein [Terriglobales bacterium]
MPMYEYVCRDCGQQFERLSWTAAPAAPACACGSRAVERIWFSRVAMGHTDGGASAADFAGCGETGGGCCGGGMCGRGEGDIQ